MLNLMLLLIIYRLLLSAVSMVFLTATTLSMFTFTMFSLPLPCFSPGGLRRLDRKLLLVLWRRWRLLLGVRLAAVLTWSRIRLTGISLLIVVTCLGLLLLRSTAVMVARVLALATVLRF